VLSAEALGTQRTPYTGTMSSDQDDAIGQAYKRNTNYKGFWLSFWTVSTPVDKKSPTDKDYYDAGYAAGAFAAQHELDLAMKNGARMPDYIAADLEGYGYATQNSCSQEIHSHYVNQIDGWAAGVNSKNTGMKPWFYVCGESYYQNAHLETVTSAKFQDTLSPAGSATPVLKATGNVGGFQGLSAVCRTGNNGRSTAESDVAHVRGWGGDISQVEFGDGKDDCGPQ